MITVISRKISIIQAHDCSHIIFTLKDSFYNIMRFHLSAHSLLSLMTFKFQIQTNTKICLQLMKRIFHIHCAFSLSFMHFFFPAASQTNMISVWLDREYQLKMIQLYAKFKTVWQRKIIRIFLTTKNTHRYKKKEEKFIVKEKEKKYNNKNKIKNV